MSNQGSASYLRERLARTDRARAMYQTEALYNMQVEWTCRLLDVVDEITDPVTAQLITDVIYERLTGDGVSEAAQRQREVRAELERLMRGGPPPFAPPAR